MSIRQVQTSNFLNFILHSYLTSGKRPTEDELLKLLAKFFATHPAGMPVRPEGVPFGSQSLADAEAINDFMAAVYVNLHTLFEQIDAHVEQNMILTTSTLSELRLINARRRYMSGLVDDQVHDVR